MERAHFIKLVQIHSKSLMTDAFSVNHSRRTHSHSYTGSRRQSHETHMTQIFTTYVQHQMCTTHYNQHFHITLQHTIPYHKHVAHTQNASDTPRLNWVPCTHTGMTHDVDYDTVNAQLQKLRETDGLDVELSYDGMKMPVHL